MLKATTKADAEETCKSEAESEGKLVYQDLLPMPGNVSVNREHAGKTIYVQFLHELWKASDLKLTFIPEVLIRFFCFYIRFIVPLMFQQFHYSSPCSLYMQSMPFIISCLYNIIAFSIGFLCSFQFSLLSAVMGPFHLQEYFQNYLAVYTHERFLQPLLFSTTSQI